MKILDLMFKDDKWMNIGLLGFAKSLHHLLTKTKFHHIL